jgi:HNH endonuclease/AP2 domain
MKPFLDPEDEHLWEEIPWVQRKDGYWQHTSYTDGTVYLHRLIAGAGPGEYVDHRDRDPNNNRRSNLRLCTQGQNIANARKRTTHNGRKPTSKFKGVCWAAWTNCWRVTCKGKHVGYFHSEEEAARAYDREARHTFGEFAKTNQ